MAHGRAAQPGGAASPGTTLTEGQVVRIVVYVMLVLSAGVAVLFGDRLWSASREGLVPVWAPLVAPATFTVFMFVYTVDRWLLVRRYHYPLTRALFQVAFALVFLTLLLPQQASELHQLRQNEPTGRDAAAAQLLAHPDEAVRAAACELLLGQHGGQVVERVQSLSQLDTSPRVRTSCHHALERLRANGG